MNKKYRIFIGLMEISGYFSNLNKGLKQQGADSVFVDYGGHPYKYGGDDVPDAPVKLLKWSLNKWKASFKSNILIRRFYWLLWRISQFVVFAWALIRYDVFIFGFNTSFLHFNGFHYDFPILKMFRKKIICVYLGSDSRPSYLDGSIIGHITDKDGMIDIARCAQLAEKTKKNLLNVEKYADYIINFPPQAHFHERPFVSGLMIGIPFELNVKKDDASGDRCLENKVRILHSPSDPIARGTDNIRSVIAALKSKGYDIEFIEITGKPHQVVLDELSRCDFIVDSLYSDTPMAMFSTEAAWYGKPAVMSGYYSKYVRDDVPEDKIPPSLFCDISEIEQAIEKMIVDVDYRKWMGERARDFVRREWNIKTVAERYMKLVEDNAPAEWFYDPCRNGYLYGGGLHEEKLKRILRELIDYGGIVALQLSDKPLLEKKFGELALSAKDGRHD
jgi:glycosyltransferase involved in cell wall biosynthesis